MSVEAISSLLLVGAGKMGGALLDGWLAGGLPPKAVTLLDPAPDSHVVALIDDEGMRLNPDLSEVPAPEFVVIAIKPQMMVNVLPTLGHFADGGSAFLSIAAGQTIADIERGLGREAGVVRAMPNTPAAVGVGMSVLVANALVPADARTKAEALMAAVGLVRWIDDEDLMDAVTAVSGSGPAYVFHLVECMAAAGEAAGLPSDLAATLARQTVIGGGALMKSSSQAPETLRKNVTSPGGTTAAALDVLMREENSLKDLLTEAVAAAKQRGRELSG